MATLEFNLDNSAFSLLSCSRKFQLRVIRGLAEPKNDEAAFGDGVHKSLEYLDKGDSPDDMVVKLQKQGITDIPKVLSLITFFKSAIKLPPPIILLDNKPAVEIKFRHHYASIMLPGSHEKVEIYLVGTIDRIHIDEKTGSLVILDYKTTSAATKYQIDKKIKEYQLAFQLAFYLYALKNFGILPASYLELIELHKYRLEIMLLSYNTNPPSFTTIPRFAFNDDFINREVPMIINAKINQSIAIAALNGPAPKDGMTVYQACTFCGYRNACLVAGTERENEILSHFEILEYNPLNFR